MMLFNSQRNTRGAEHDVAIVAERVRRHAMEFVSTISSAFDLSDRPTAHSIGTSMSAASSTIRPSTIRSPVLRRHAAARSSLLSLRRPSKYCASAAIKMSMNRICDAAVA